MSAVWAVIGLVLLLEWPEVSPLFWFVLGATAMLAMVCLGAWLDRVLFSEHFDDEEWQQAMAEADRRFHEEGE